MPGWLSTTWYEVCRCHIMAGLTLGFSLRFEGGRNIPAEGPALLIANHESFLDPIAVGLTTTGALAAVGAIVVVVRGAERVAGAAGVAAGRRGAEGGGLTSTSRSSKSGAAVCCAAAGTKESGSKTEVSAVDANQQSRRVPRQGV